MTITAFIPEIVTNDMFKLVDDFVKKIKKRRTFKNFSLQRGEILVGLQPQNVLNVLNTPSIQHAANMMMDNIARTLENVDSFPIETLDSDDNL